MIPSAFDYIPGSVPIFDQWDHLHMRMLYGVVFCNNADKEAYTWEGKDLSADELIQELANLVEESDGFVKAIVEPFHRDDLDSHAKLRVELQGVAAKE